MPIHQREHKVQLCNKARKMQIILCWMTYMIVVSAIIFLIKTLKIGFNEIAMRNMRDTELTKCTAKQGTHNMYQYKMLRKQ